MSVTEAFQIAGEVYIMGIIIALGIAALIKLICYSVSRSEAKQEEKAQLVNAEEGGAK